MAEPSPTRVVADGESTTDEEAAFIGRPSSDSDSGSNSDSDSSSACSWSPMQPDESLQGSPFRLLADKHLTEPILHLILSYLSSGQDIIMLSSTCSTFRESKAVSELVAVCGELSELCQSYQLAKCPEPGTVHLEALDPQWIDPRSLQGWSAAPPRSQLELLLGYRNRIVERIDSELRQAASNTAQGHPGRPWIESWQEGMLVPNGFDAHPPEKLTAEILFQALRFYIFNCWTRGLDVDEPIMGAYDMDVQDLLMRGWEGVSWGDTAVRDAILENLIRLLGYTYSVPAYKLLYEGVLIETD